MQNHYEINSKSQFWTRHVRNWSKSLTERLGKINGIYVIFQDLSRRTHKGPYGPIRAHIWARMGPARALEEREKFGKNIFRSNTSLSKIVVL